MSMRRNWCLRIGVLLAITACGGSSATSVTAPEPNLTGLWSSTGSYNQYSDVRMQLTESNAGTITGQWTATESRGGSPGDFTMQGAVSGSRSGSNAVLTLQGCSVTYTAGCGMTYTAHLTTADRMIGNITFAANNSNFTATFDR